MINLTIDEITYLHEKLIQKTGGMSGIRDIGMNDRVLHIVAGTDNINVYIITAYFPNSEEFHEDSKTRRER